MIFAHAFPPQAKQHLHKKKNPKKKKPCGLHFNIGGAARQSLIKRSHMACNLRRRIQFHLKLAITLNLLPQLRRQRKCLLTNSALPGVLPIYCCFRIQQDTVMRFVCYNVTPPPPPPLNFYLEGSIKLA